MMTGQQPIIVLKEGTKREKGKGAQSNNIMAALAISEAVKSTLGPKGMDKMLVDSMGDVVVTNDGATILKEIDVEHPAAKMIVEVAKSQDEECGDGTTSAVVLTGELLKHAEDLLEQNIHPTVICGGYKLAADKAIEVLKNMAINVKEDDKKVLIDIAVTSMASKGASGEKEKLAGVVVDGAVRDIDDIVKNLKSRLPDSIKFGRLEHTIVDLLRDIGLGQALVSNTETIRCFILDVRPRVSVHGGFEL